MPIYSRIFSIRTLVLLIIGGCSLIFASILLWSGTSIINVLIYQFGDEILTEKLNSVIQPVEYRYSTLQRIGLEDSLQHRDEIKQNALKNLAGFRYKQTGSVFVISKAGKIIISNEFTNTNNSDFKDFITGLNDGSGQLTFSIGKHKRFSVFRFYQPWDSYIGLAIDQEELFIYKTLFVRIVLMLLAAVLLGTLLFSSLIQRLLITPLIRLSLYANQISKGNYDPPLDGKYILELGALKVDVQQMVTTLRQKIEQTNAQLQLISERERWLDEALTALQESEKNTEPSIMHPVTPYSSTTPKRAKLLMPTKGCFRCLVIIMRKSMIWT